ncbi:MAG: HAD-IC family P-type ATPase [Pseudomonadota bacterium]
MASAPFPPTGLTEQQVLAQRRRDGPNRLPEAKPKSLWLIAWGAFTQPMFLLLLATAAVYGVLGELMDAAMLLVSVLAVGALSVYQEHRTERVLHALKDLSSPRCTVIRDGRAVRVASQELVVGDRLVVDEGDRLAADAQLVECSGLQVDESLLTGESVPVAKRVGGSDQAAQLHAGSLVVQGDGVAVVNATGARTALGRIGGSLALLQPRPSRLHQELKRLVQAVAVLALLTCVIAATVYTVREGSWTAGLLVGLTLAMSLIPEEFAVVWSVMLALGAWRLAKVEVLTRQPQAIEALGTVSVLCVDKTGTLTHNRMSLVALHDGQTESPLPASAAFDPLLQAAALASVPNSIEPMDRAIFAAAGARAAPPPAWTAGPRLGVRDGRPFVSHWWQDGARGAQVVLKGAPERVLALCAGDAARTQALAREAERWSARGLRVLAVAQGQADAAPADGGVPRGLRLQALGLLGFMDPLREEVPAAIEQCHQAGVRVIMITGDSPITARAIARDAGLLRNEDAAVLTGAQLAQLGDFELQQALRGAQVFARVDPAQKLRIVQALQQRGEVVAMTGDGVNDAPALRAADIGVAMGQRGTDVAREAAALVLLDDNFASLVQAVRAGRRIFVNLRKALGYLFAVHVPIVGVSLIPVVLGGPVLLLPLHVVLLELIIDPACSLVFEAEPEPDDCMRVPPRPASARLFSVADAVRALAVGGAAFAGVAALQWWARGTGASIDLLRLASLGGIVAANLLMLLWFRGLRPDHDHTNRVFHALLLGIGLVWVLLLGVPGVGPVFGLPASTPWSWSAAAAVPAAWALWQLWRHKRRSGR